MGQQPNYTSELNFLKIGVAKSISITAFGREYNLRFVVRDLPAVRFGADYKWTQALGACTSAMVTP